MGFRFHRTLALLPWLKVNFSKGGASLSVGEHGMTENFSTKGAKTTVGLPGTGLSYSKLLSFGSRKNPSEGGIFGKSGVGSWIWVGIVLLGFAVYGLCHTH